MPATDTAAPTGTAKPADWRVYRDGSFYFVGRQAWQTCTSRTAHVAGELENRREVREVLAWARGLTAAEAEQHRHETDTWDRFETAYAHVPDPF